MKFLIDCDATLGGGRSFSVTREDRDGHQEFIQTFGSVDAALACIGSQKRKPGSPLQRIVIETETYG